MEQSELVVYCKYCGERYDLSEVKRKYGEESMVYQLGYCSAQCYTKSRTVNKTF